MTELWRTIKEFPEYEISNQGRLRRSIEKGFRYLRGSIHKQGYIHYFLSQDGKEFGRLAHRLVAIAFLSPPTDPSHTKVCHNDSNPKNNVWTNLRWDNQTGNISDRRPNGTELDGEKGPNAKFTIEDVRWIRQMWADYGRRGLIKELAETLDCPYSRVSEVLKGKTWAHVK